MIFVQILIESLGGKSCSECMMSKEEYQRDKNIKNSEEEAIISAVIQKAPQVKISEEYKAVISDSYHDEIPKVDIVKERTYTDLKDYERALERSRDLAKEGGVGIAGLVAAGASKNFGSKGSAVMGSVIGGYYYSLETAHLDDKREECDLQMRIQKDSFSEGVEKLGEAKVKELARAICENNNLFEGEYNVDKINRASGDLYKDVTGKK